MTVVAKEERDLGGGTTTSEVLQPIRTTGSILPMEDPGSCTSIDSGNASGSKHEQERFTLLVL